MEPVSIAIFLALIGNFWQQSRENSKTRDELRGEIKGARGEISDLDTKLSGEISDLDTKLSGEISDLDTKLSGEIKGLDTKLSGEIKVLGVGLGDVRERLARIEGHLGIGIAKPADPRAGA